MNTRLEDKIKISKERLIASANNNICKKSANNKTRKQKGEKNLTQRIFKGQIGEIAHEKT